MGDQVQPDAAAAAWYNVTATLDCGDEDSNSDDVLSCMRAMSWQDVQDVLPAGTGLFTSDFAPTIDDTVVFSDYPARSASGKVANRPLLIGSNDNEAGLFKPISAAQNIILPQSTWDYLQLVRFTCPTSSRAVASVVNGLPTWRYRWFGDFPNLQLTSVPASGAWHGAEVPVIFGTDLDIQNVTDRTAAESEIAEYVRGAWVAFAKDPAKGLDE